MKTLIKDRIESFEDLFIEVDRQIEHMVWENLALQEIAKALRFGDIIITATDGKMTNVRLAHNMRSPDRNHPTEKG